MEGTQTMHSELLDSHANHLVAASQQLKTKRKYSLESLLRPGRAPIRLTFSVPSNPPVPQPIDYHIAQALLNPNSVLIPQIQTAYGTSLEVTEAPSSHLPRFVPQQYEGSSNTTELSTSSGTMFDPSDHRFFDSSATRERDTSDYVKLYNGLARRNGLVTLDVNTLAELSHYTESSIATGSSPRASRGWCGRSVLRHVASSASIGVLRRAASTATLGNLPRSALSKYRSLEITARLAGVNVLRLDKTLSPMPLVLPGPLFATASYLQDQVRSTPCLFRVPGDPLVANTVYGHLVRYLEGVRHEEVEQMVGCAVLPAPTNNFSYTGHDISSTFKKLVSNIPGGVLGSLGLFLALREVGVSFPVDNDTTEALRTSMKCHLIALAISSVTSELRYAVICAVFGLVAMVAEKEDALQTENLLGNLVPSPVVKALSIIFGRLLLADLQDEIDVSPQNDRGEPSVEQSPARGLRRAWRPFRSTKPAPTELKKPSADYERDRQCSAVTEMLLSHWREVSRHLKVLRRLNRGLQKPLSSFDDEAVEGGYSISSE